MERIKIAQIFADQEQFGGKEVLVSGWARTIRDMKNFGFIELNDGSCFKSLQVVLERGKLENYDEVARQNVGAAFIVHGALVLTLPIGGFITLGCLIALMQYALRKSAEKKEAKEKALAAQEKEAA